MPIFDTVLARRLAKLFEGVLKRMNRLRKERKAGQILPQQAEDQMERIFGQTLNRLRKGNAENSWWENALSFIGHQYTSPNFLKKPAVQEWLHQDKTARDLYALAKKEIIKSREDNSEIRSRLATSYSQHTGEINREANTCINTIVTMLVQGYQSTISDDLRPVIGMNQALSQNISKHLDPGRNALPSPDPIVQQAHTKHANQALHNILTFRLFDPPKARQDIQELWQQVNSGNLSLAEPPTKFGISYWTARLCASSAETVPVSREIRATLKQGDTNWNLSIIDALLANTDGETNEALRILRAQNDPDTRSVFFHILTHSRSEQDALAWHDSENPSNDLSFFTAIGWKNWAVCMSRDKKWEEAIYQLAKIECLDHDIPVLRFIEGMINAAMLLPEDFRNIALEKVPIYENVAPSVGEKYETYHARATACFELVEKCLIEIVNHELTQVIADWRLWLRLMDLKTEAEKSTRDEIRQSMEDGEQATNLMMFAWAFNIIFNVEPIKRYLERRKQFGGLDDRDFLAEFLLADISKTPHDLVIYLEKNSIRLKQIISPVVVIGINICALVNDDQLEKARKALENDRNELDKRSLRRLTTMIEAKEGKDIRSQLENNYRETNDLIDLQNLVQHLKVVNDHKALRPLLQELFRRDSTPENAHNYVACLTIPPFTDYEEIIRFLDANPNVLSQNDDLGAVKAQALFQVGRFADSRVINDVLLHKRMHSRDMLLDIDIAIATGDWERIPEIVSREWPRRDSHTAETLMTFAQLASLFDQSADRALQLARLATEKTLDDPKILMAAYALYIQLGRDSEVNPDWLTRALELSSPDKGPLWQINLPDLMERIPQHREHMHATEKQWLEGGIPTSLAVNLFNVPLTRLLTEVPDQNAVELDGRRRMMLPIIAGGRSIVELQKNWVIGLDITSITILFYLGLLEKTIGAFEHVKIAPETMRFLALEKNKIRFHQPSQIKTAKQLRTLIRSNHLRVVTDTQILQAAIVNEVGSELAFLLHKAKSESGKVVCTLPIYKVGSFKNKEADICDYKDQIVSVVDFCAVLHSEGKIIDDDYSRITSFLLSQGQTEHANIPRTILDEPIFIDRLALSYLQSADMLTPVSTGGLNIQIHPDVVADMDALIQAEDASDLLMRKIESIRGIMRDAVDSGTASFLSNSPDQDEESLHLDMQSQATTSLLAACAACDALCIDDRYINGGLTVRTDADAVPVVCVLDILWCLVSWGHLNEIDHWNIRHKLRRGGFVFIPFEAEELVHWLKATTCDETGLKETAELRVIRQTTARINYLGLAKLQETIVLSANIVSACITTIRALWSEESSPAEQATAQSDWIWRHLMMTATLARQHAEQDTYSNRLRTVVINRLASLYLPIFARSKERRYLYANWVNQSVLESFWSANTDVVRETVEVACDTILSLEVDQVDQYGSLFLTCLPEALRRFVREKQDFAERFGIQARRSFNLGADISLTDIDLFAAAKKVLSKGKRKILKSNGRKISISLDTGDGSIVLEWRDTNSLDQRAKLPDFSLLSSDPKVRTATLRNLVKRFGPTAPDFHHLIQKAETRELDHNELSCIFEEEFNGVAAIQRELFNKIEHGFSAADLVPDSLPYFEQFFGPLPDTETPDLYFRGLLTEHRKRLLDQDLKTGIDICCLGALRDDLMPGQWLQAVDNDTLWDALSSCNVFDNPFSLLGALDIALYRQDDDRFQKFTADAVNQLTDDKFGQAEDTDIWTLITIFSNLILNRINVLENGPHFPSYWKRMCAWMQAGIITRNLVPRSSKHDIDSLQKWAHRSMITGGLYVMSLETRQEPMHLTSQTLRNEVLDHLLTLKLRHESKGRTFPRSNSIDQALIRCKDSGQPFVAHLPGILEGHQRSHRRIPDSIKKELKLQGIKNPESFPWSAVAAVSQSFSLGKLELKHTRNAVESITVNSTLSTLDEKLESLNMACIVAATNGDKMLANAIANATIRLTKNVSKASQILAMLVIFLHAAAAHTEEEAWLEWLEKMLADFADQIPNNPKDFLQLFFTHLSVIETILPLRSWLHIRAKSIASAGLDVERPRKFVEDTEESGKL